MKHALLAAVLVLSGGSLAGCGGSATAAEFCDVYVDLYDVKTGKDAKAWSDRLDGVGEPEGLTDEQKDGLEIAIRESGNYEDEENLQNIQPDLSADDEKKVAAFAEWVKANCGEAAKQKQQELMPTDAPSVPSPSAS